MARYHAAGPSGVPADSDGEHSVQVRADTSFARPGRQLGVADRSGAGKDLESNQRCLRL